MEDSTPISCVHIEDSGELRLGVIVQANISDDRAMNDNDNGMNMVQTGGTELTYAMIVLMRREVCAWNVPVTGSSDVSTSILLACMDCRRKRQMK